MLRVHSILLLLGLVSFSLKGQTPFTCEGQVWIIEQDSDALLEMTIGSNNSIVTTLIKDNIGVQLFAMGFRKTDRMLYGIHPLSHELYRIDVNGNIENIASPNVDPSLIYLAGDVTPDGSAFVIIGSNSGQDVKLFSINLASGNYEVQEFGFDNGTSTVDIGFHPLTTTMFGFDGKERRFYTHNLGSNAVNAMPPIFFEHNVKGIYFDAFGNMFGVGTALFGSISGLFDVDQTTGETKLISTTGLIPIADMAGCPFSLEMDNRVIPEVVFPCSDIAFEYTFANQTGEVMNNILLEHEVPIGYSFVPPTAIPFGGVLDNTTPENLLRIENLMIPKGIHTFTVQAYVDDIPKAQYKSQATLSNVPPEYGSMVNSNDPVSPAIEDSTRMEVNRIDEDSLSFESFLCHGSALTLDASDYGNNLTWSTGATSQQINVFETGLFTMTASSGCQELFVSYEVVSASCPYTIEVRHMVEPDTLLGCSEVLFRYILENDSGEERYNLTFLDILPTGFTFLEIINNPYDSELTTDLAPNVFQLENLLLHEGIDTIDVLIQVGNIPPGDIRNKAMLKGLPQLLGTFRSSDDPATNTFLDSTTFFVKGVEGGSLVVDTFLCTDANLSLDASLYGDAYLWNDGSSDSQLTTSKVGEYQVLILNGCDTADVTFHVEEGASIDVAFSDESYSINQSESIRLQPLINNAGDSLTIRWNDEMSNSLSCFVCPQPTATPWSDIIYSIHVENEFCSDSALIEILVDETRRIYTPTAFSPNYDGINDYFYLQSPDPATVLSFQVFNRWGNLVFETKDIPINQAQAGWDGNINGQLAQPGVYVWQAEIQFVDSKKEWRSGDIMLMY